MKVNYFESSGTDKIILPSLILLRVRDEQARRVRGIQEYNPSLHAKFKEYTFLQSCFLHFHYENFVIS